MGEPMIAWWPNQIRPGQVCIQRRDERTHNSLVAQSDRTWTGMYTEGGMREPTIAWWPNQIRPGQVCIQRER